MQLEKEDPIEGTVVFKTVTVNEAQVEVQVLPTGYFRAVRVSDRVILTSASRYEDVVKVITKATKRVRVRISVPYTLDNGKLAEVTGKHATSEQWLVDVEGEKGGQQQSTGEVNNYSKGVLPRLNGEDRVTLQQLIKESNEAQQKLAKWKDERRVQLGESLKKAWVDAGGDI